MHFTTKAVTICRMMRTVGGQARIVSCLCLALCVWSLASGPLVVLSVRWVIGVFNWPVRHTCTPTRMKSVYIMAAVVNLVYRIVDRGLRKLCPGLATLVCSIVEVVVMQTKPSHDNL